jgi:amino acid adenylation domain-containing protein
MCIRDRSAFVRWATRQPHALALSAGDDSLTYGELLDRSQQLAARLNHFADPGDRVVGLATSDSTAFYVAVLACWMTGRVYVPLRPSDPRSRNEAIMQSVGLKIIVNPAELDVSQVDVWDALQVLNLVDLETEPPLTDWPEPLDDDLAYVLFTSGSTGQPKGVPIRWGNLNAFSRAVLDSGLYGLGPDDRFLQAFQPTFDLSVFSFWIALQAGASVHVVPQAGQVAFNISHVLEEDRITVALMTPSVLAYLRPYFGDLHLPALRLSLFCGEALPHDLTAEWATCVPNARIENVYGPTEATIFCTRYVWDADRSARESSQGIVPIGTALPGTILCLDAPDGDEGELLLAGDQVFSGYWQNHERTGQVLHTTDTGLRVYRSGDRCRRLPDGVFQYLERVDFQVKIDGYRIELGEIEHHARLLAGGAPVAALVLPTESAPVLVLCVLGTEYNPDSIQQGLKESLPQYMVPRLVLTLTDFPLTSSGKIDRQALAAHARQSALGVLGLT